MEVLSEVGTPRLNEAKQEAEEDLKNLKDNLEDKVKEAGEDVDDAVSKAEDEVEKTVKGAEEQAKELVEKADTEVNGLLEGATDLVEEESTKATDEINETAADAKKELNELAEEAKDISEGIKSGLGKEVEAAKSDSGAGGSETEGKAEEENAKNSEVPAIVSQLQTSSFPQNRGGFQNLFTESLHKGRGRLKVK